MSLSVESYELPPIGTQCYVILHPEREELAVFDAPLNAWPTVEAIAAKSGLRISGLYLTHGHWDHTLDAHHFNAAGIPVFAHEDDRLFYETPEVMSAFTMPGLEISKVKVDHWIEDGRRMEILGRPVEARLVPGHSPGSLMYWFTKDKVAISGDALFQGSIGRTDFPNGSFEQLAEAIRRNIYSLPDDTIIYPGHGPSTTVGAEASGNPFVTR